MARYNTDGLFAVFNVSENKANYSQRNNLYRFQNKNAKENWATMCNVTSMCMAADYTGYKFPKGEFDQPEDNLGKFMITNPEVDAFYKEKMPAMYTAYKNGDKDCYTPNEVHAILSFGFNKWIGCNATEFSMGIPIHSIISEIVDNSHPVVLSGKFGNLFHIVCLVGLKVPVSKIADGIKFDDVVEFIIDDPYGDYHDGYTNGKEGNDVHVSKADFISIFKPFNDENVKWGHLFHAPAATV